MIIRNPIQTISAHLVWQSPLEGGGSRRRLPVALLRAQPDGSVFFDYLKDTESYAEAVEEGFDGYTGIPLDREDTSDAISTLGQRLPNIERPDYHEFLERFGLDESHSLSTLSLLAYTGAKMTSDSFSVSETFEGFDRPFQYVFDVAGRRHYINETPGPQPGDEVLFQREPENEHDPDAIAMVDRDGNCYGYLNACYAEAGQRWLANGQMTGTVFRVNGRSSYPRLFVFADIVPKLP